MTRQHAAGLSQHICKLQQTAYSSAADAKQSQTLDDHYEIQRPTRSGKRMEKKDKEEHQVIHTDSSEE